MSNIYAEAERDKITRAVTFSQSIEQRLDVLIRECNTNRLDRLGYATDMYRIEQALKRIEDRLRRPLWKKLLGWS
jgi:hypothetical protein